MPDAARTPNYQICTILTPKPHLGGSILPPCETTVQIGFLPAARKGDLVTCLGAPTEKNSITTGESSVQIGYQDAARVGDRTAHQGFILCGCPTVKIGSNAQSLALSSDKAFGDVCEGS